MWIRGRICIVTAALLLPSVAESQGSLRDALVAARERHGVPAMAAAVATSDRMIAIEAVGVARLGQPNTVLPTDRFHLGGITMGMTATLLAVLVEEGRVRWESRVLDIFPETAATARPEYSMVTLADLLSHRAGFPPYTSPSEFTGLPEMPGGPVERRSAFTRYLLSQPPAGPYGEFLQSSAGYAVAAAVAERLTGVAWKDLMRTRLFEPITMAAGFDWPALVDPVQPWGHWLQEEVLTPHDPNGDYHVPDIIRPGADVHVALADYVLFMQLHLRGLAGRESFLTQETFARLHRPPEGGNYALGWIIDELNGAPLSAHPGGAGTFYGLVGLVPTRDVAAIVVANAGHEPAQLAVQEVANAIIQLWLPPPTTP